MDRRSIRTMAAFFLLGTMLTAMVGGVLGQAVHQSEAASIAVLHREQEAAQQQVRILQERVANEEKQKQLLDGRIQTLDKQVNDLQKRNQEQQRNMRSILSSRSEGLVSEASFGPWETFTATWYSPQGGVGNGLTTATGTTVDDHTIAVDPSVIPLGSVVEVMYPDGSTEIKKAVDTGGDIHGYHVDIFNWSESYCMSKGVEHIKLRIIGRG